MSSLYKDSTVKTKGPEIWTPYKDDNATPDALPSGFDRLDKEYNNLLTLVKNIQNALLLGKDTDSSVVSNFADHVTNEPNATTPSNSNTANVANKPDEITPSNSNSNTANVANKTNEITTTNTNTTDSGSNGDKRAIEMLVTDVEYIKRNTSPLESSVNGKRADVLLHYLMEAANPERRKVEDFTKVPVNLKKLLQIVAKLKLWVPPQRHDDSGEPESDAKKEVSPFISSKEKDNAATEIVKELVGLRCKQWGLDGLLNSYGELSDTVKNCLLCFSVFKCDVDKNRKDGVLIQKSLLIKKRILIHWWVAEGLIDLYRKESNPQDASNPNHNSSPIVNQNPQSEGNPHDASNPDYNLSPFENPNPDQNLEVTPSSGNPNPDPIPNPQSDPNQESKEKTIEEIGEEILKILVKKGFIEPVIKKAQESGSFQMHPFVHSFVTALAKKAGFFDFSDTDGQLTPSFRLSQRACLVKSKDKLSSCQQWEKYTEDRNKLKRFGEVQTLFNVDESIIDIKPEWFSKMKNLHVLHLGSWRSDPVEHIEVEDQKFLEDLKIMKQLRLFSLQGLSTIMKLTDSVCALTNLIILDLKECHNLEELPSEIGSLKNLTHLDITNCHLLTKLPIGISLLSKLEVLKGFVIYGQASDQEVRKSCVWWRKTKGCLIHDVFRCKNKEVCTLKDLVKLTKLRELSLVVNIDIFPTEEEVQVFKEMRELRKLKISWEKSFKEIGGDNKASAKSSKKCGWCFPSIRPAVTENVSTRGLEVRAQNAPKGVCCCMPSSKVEEESHEYLDQIKKLELWCLPCKEAPTWLHPDQLKNLEKLYIKGGSLEILPGFTENKQWKSITTLRLKYLPNIRILWIELRTMFPNMRYLEKYDCEKLPFFPCDQEGVGRSWEERLRERQERTMPQHNPTTGRDRRAQCEYQRP